MSETEIADLEIAARIDENILWFQIAMNDLLRMDRFQAGEQLRERVDRLGQWHHATFPVIVEGAARHILQHEKMARSEIHMLVECHYMGMEYARGSAR